ncbi:hypothetical protein E3D81_14185 [Sphingobacterium sp. CZ-2]|nr:hypothetical protein E3D81_14185 [Sphingobacterium sp. CZ-2]
MNMKNWLRAGAALLACIFGLLAFYAFQKADKSSEKATLLTWYFISNDVMDRTKPDAYALTEDEERPCDNIKQEICSILAPDNGYGKPDLNALATSSETHLQQIERAIADLEVNETVHAFRAKY